MAALFTRYLVLVCLLTMYVGAQEKLNFCAEGGYMVGHSQSIGSEPSDYNWGRAGIGCSRLKCTECGAMVRAEARARDRYYECDCTQWRCSYLESVTEYRTRGPADIPVEMPPWRCIGHPVRDWPGAFSEDELRELAIADDYRELAGKWDKSYHRWASTPGQKALLEQLSDASAPALLQFWSWNPEACDQDIVAVVKKIEDPQYARVVAQGLNKVYRQDKTPEVLEIMREMALKPGFCTAFIPLIDKYWLRRHAQRMLDADPDCAKVLCARAARGDCGWDKDALRTLPLELIRGNVAKMPRSQLTDELQVYYERDYTWLSDHMPELCREASDFFFYFESHLEKHDWSPDEEMLVLWHEQALDPENAHNALPGLVKFDREWVCENLGDIIDRSKTRGVWLVDELKQAGVDIRPLLPILRERDPKDLEGHLPLWFPEEEKPTDG
jgi:hypothetical protein